MIDKQGTAHLRPLRRPGTERPPHAERGLFDSTPRFVLIVGLLAAATTGPSAALAVVGWSCLSRASAPATTPFLADADAAGSVVVPEAGTAESAEPLPVAQREPLDAETSPTSVPTTGWLARAI
jgi:hypothetical protein